MTFSDQIYLDLSEVVYNSATANIDGYQQLILSGLTNNEGYYSPGNDFACAAYKNGNNIVISFRGTDTPIDWIDSDLSIALGSIPTISLAYAMIFYDEIKNNPLYADCNISFTGHSLGGAIAELMGAMYGNTTVTFNAPGMEDQATSLGLTYSDNVTNYVIMNDYVGNFRAHVGDTYYIQPVPIDNNPLYDTHLSILDYTETVFGGIFSKPIGFGTNEALALWYYDVNNNDTIIRPTVGTQISTTDLENAINIINSVIGTPIHSLYYSTPDGDYILDNDGSHALAGSDGNDKIWGNEGSDNITGGAGNDLIYGDREDGSTTMEGATYNDIINGGAGNDTIYGGAGNDVIDGGSGTNKLYGGTGDEVITSGSGNDLINGGSGNNVLQGGTGSDTYIIGEGSNTITDFDGGVLVYSNSGRYSFLTSPTSKISDNFYTDNKGDTFQWDGNAGSTLTITLSNGTTTTVNQFHNGLFGLYFPDKPKPEPPPPFPGPSPTPFRQAEGIPEIRRDPIIFDLNGDGIKTTSASNGVYFDHNHDGYAELSAWVAPDDGILAVDTNENGIIDNGSELVASLTSYDTNSDGVINSTDTNFSSLKILKSDGALQTLTEAGIASINLSTSATNITDENGNTQLWTGTYTKSDNSTAAFGDYNFLVNNVDSVATDWVDMSTEILELPDAKGFGSVYSLRQAMARDTSGELQGLVESFIAATDLATKREILTNIIYKWTGADEINPSDRGPSIDAQQLYSLEKFMGETFVGFEGTSNPNSQAANILKSAYANLSNYIYAQLESQTALKPLFDLIINVQDPTTGNVMLDLSDVAVSIQTAISQDEATGKELLADFDRTLKFLGLKDISYYTSFNNTFSVLGSDYKFLLESSDKTIIYGTSGNDSLDGSASGETYMTGDGNDTIYSRQGEDIVYAGNGDDYIDSCEDNDIIYGEAGNDTIFSGDGNDTLFGGDNNDYIDAGKGSDFVYGDDGDDYILGGDDNDILYGGNGNNTLDGGAGADTLSGTGNDIYIIDSNDVLIENINEGTDTVKVGFDYTLGDNLENLEYTGSVDWSGTGNELNNNIVGNIGNDTLNGKTGNDYLNGGGGDDTYVFNLGDGNDTVSDYYEPYWWTTSDSGTNDTIIFGEGITKDNIIFSGNDCDLIITYVGANDSIRIQSQLSENNRKIENFVFADGSSYTSADIWGLLTTYGTDGNDTISGSLGNDKIYAGGGNDSIYSFDRHDNYSPWWNGPRIYQFTGNDTVYGGDGNDIIIDDSENNYLDGGTGDDVITGGSNSDTLVGGAGNDYLYGRIGNDTYTFNFGDGNDTVIDCGDMYSYGGDDTIIFGAGITKDNVRFSGNGEDIIISFEDYSDTIRLWEQDHSVCQIENFIFADGTSYTYSDVLGLLMTYGTDNNDYLTDSYANEKIYGYGGDDTIISNCGNDTLYGGDGNDSINVFYNDAFANYLDGGAGDDAITGGLNSDTLYGGTGNDYILGQADNDTYIFNLGDGNDTIYEDSGTDTLQFGVGITKDNIRFGENNGDLIVSFTDTSDSIRIQSSLMSPSQRIENFIFADGTSYTYTDVSNLLVIYGTESNDYLTDIYANEEIYGYGGDDTIISNCGNDTIFGGEGNDYINNYSGFNYLYGEIGNDTLSDTLDGAPGNNTMVGGTEDDTYYISNTSDIVVENANEGIDTVNSSVTYILGNNIENLTLIGQNAVNGTGNELDNIIIGNANDNTLTGGLGSDYLNAGNGSDTYIFNLGDGNDTINDTSIGTTDTIVFGEGISKSNIKFNTCDDANILISFTNSQDTIMLLDQNDYSRIENFIFADGSSYTFNDVLELLEIDGTNNDDILIGTSFNEKIYGYGGSDYIYSAYSADTIDGGDGNDTIYSETTTNTISGGAGNDSIYLCNGDYSEVDSGIGDDIIYSENDSNLIDMGEGNDSIYTIYTADTIYGGNGNDTINMMYTGDFVAGEDGNDSIYSFSGNDTIDGGVGDDTIYAETTNDNIKGGDGNDSIYLINGYYNVVDGEDGNDSIYTSYCNNSIEGGAGDDYVYSTYGNNLIETEDDNDSIYSENASDTINSGIGDDYISSAHTTNLIYAGEGNDTIYSEATANTIYADNGNDSIYLINGDYNIVNGGDGNDSIYSSYTSNSIVGGAGDDYVYSKYGYNLVETGEGNDIIYSESTSNTINSGTGDDFISSTYTTNLIYAGDGNDTIYSDTTTNTIYAGDGNDSICFARGDYNIVDSGAGNDTISFGSIENLYTSISDASGTDTIDFSGYSKDSISFGMNGNDLLINGAIAIKNWFVSNDNKIENFIFADGIMTSNDIDALFIFGDENDNDLTGTDGADSINGGEGNDTINGGDGNDLIYGGAGNDVLRGQNGIDTVYGGAGDDQIWNNPEVNYFYGGEGNDTYFIDSYENVITENINEGTDLISSSVTNTLEANIENLTLTGTDNINGTGNELDNVIAGNSGSNLLNGGEGNDSMYGNAGNDIFTDNYGSNYIDGGDDDDYLSISASGNNTLLGGSGNDTIKSIGGANYIDGGDGDDNIASKYGNNDTVYGGAGNDKVYIYQGTNYVDGGIGNDTITGVVYFSNPLDSNNTLLGGNGDDSIVGGSSINYIDGGEGNDTISIAQFAGSYNNTISGGAGNDIISGGEGDDTFNFSLGDGTDQIIDTSGTDRVTFDNTVNKNNIAVYLDANNNLIVDYGSSSGQDVINIQNQPTNTIEQIQLNDGEYMTASDINGLIQNMSAYANANQIEFTGINDVKSNQDLMTMVASSWHS